jgi:hypothetical protein
VGSGAVIDPYALRGDCSLIHQRAYGHEAFLPQSLLEPWGYEEGPGDPNPPGPFSLDANNSVRTDGGLARGHFEHCALLG